MECNQVYFYNHLNKINYFKNLSIKNSKLKDKKRIRYKINKKMKAGKKKTIKNKNNNKMFYLKKIKCAKERLGNIINLEDNEIEKLPTRISFKKVC